MRGALMVCGTASDVGKSHVVTGLCRLLARRGVKVAPFKAQNMALNSFVTPSGHEIGRAQGVQALAAGAVPEVAMNPVLLKPTGERTSQVVVNGEPWATMSAAQYHQAKSRLLRLVLDALDDLRSRYDVVVAEGAGSPTEINLRANDIVNLRVASDAGLPVVVVGDIDRGGVFAALYGTVMLLPEPDRALIRGFVINKLRGDPALLLDGAAQLESACGVPTLGVLPYVHDVALDAEDSLALDGRRPADDSPPVADALDVAAIRLPRIANFTDLDALALEPGVGVRFVDRAAAIGQPDLIVLPGTKATVADLAWLRARGLDRAILRLVRPPGGGTPSVLLGICGGYQMMGRTIEDDGIETGYGTVGGLDLLDVTTRFAADKVVRQRRGRALGERVDGYQIHHGRVSPGPTARPWIVFDDAYGTDADGAVAGDRAGGTPGEPPLGSGVVGASLHGMFEADGFRGAFLRGVGRRRGRRFEPAGVSFHAAREDQMDRLADLLEAHLDLDAVFRLIEEGAR